jgi:pilus assembly protein Flp/PilA
MLFFQHLPRGQGLAEYALIMALVAIVIIVSLALFGTQVGNLFSKVVSSI